MDREQFQQSIDRANINSLTIGNANRIVQLLQRLRFSNNENSAKRWVWELCQNAKDGCNDTGKVKICINFSKENNTVLFKHNGKAFSMENLVSLINQASSKDNNVREVQESGKFGTGFLTTHLLSEIVNVSGILYENSSYSRFHITLDRSGHDKNEIVAALEKSIDQLHECQPMHELINKDEYITTFEYELDEDGIEVAQQGIKNLRVSAPFVLSMLQDIEEIKLESLDEVYRYNKEHECSLENASIHEITYQSKLENKSIFVLNLTEDDITISIPLDKTENGISIKPFDEGQSKLFCDFPLIGTEDFPFPVLVSSSSFNPTEPRDGVFLTCKSKTKIDQDIEENRSILKKACELYRKLLSYVAQKKWTGIYNITHINSYNTKEWYDENWMENEIISTCKDIILHTPIIRTSNNNMCELQDHFDDENVVIISDSDDTTRENIWKLAHSIIPERIACQEDIHNWYFSLWNGCNKYTFKSLTKQLLEYRHIERLQENMVEGDWKSWLTKYFSMVSKKKEWQIYINTEQMRVFPNQNGKFCRLSKLYFDKDILSAYKDILSMLGEDCREWLLHKDVENMEWFGCKVYDNEQILKDIENKIETGESQQKTNVFLQIIRMYKNGYSNLAVQKKICQYAINILGIANEFKEVSVISEKLLQDALKYAITCVADKISECRNIDNFAQHLDKSYEEAKFVLADFIEFVVKNGYENLINKITKPILPNQNGNFKVKDDLFLDDDIDETLKKLAVCAGYDIKEELLAKDFYLELPNSRQKRDVDVSQTIAKYVVTNRTSKDIEVRNNFKILLIWMNEHDEKSKLIFPELYKNKHYLYDDDEIAESIKQAQTLNTIMNKYDISSPEKLEEMIKRNKSSLEEMKVDRVEITEKVLLQLGIDSEEVLEQAFTNNDFSSRFIRTSKHDSKVYEYVKTILERSKNNIISFLRKREEYDLSDMQAISNTIFVIKKEGKEIYLLARPSDGDEIRIYYNTEKDILDYSMDWELWIEDGKSDPKKITFGRIIKLAGLNRIPLKRLDDK